MLWRASTEPRRPLPRGLADGLRVGLPLRPVAVDSLPMPGRLSLAGPVVGDGTVSGGAQT